MGRLLKKKEPSQKKKNKCDEKKSAESETETARLNFTNQTTAGTVKENQQKIAPVKKAIAGGSMYKIIINMLTKHCNFSGKSRLN